MAAHTGSRRGPRRRGGPCSSGARLAGERQDLTPAPFNVRTRVHEYGGGAYVVRDGVIVAANFADQRLYRIDQGTAPRALTAGKQRGSCATRIWSSIWRAAGSSRSAKTIAPAARRSTPLSRCRCPAATRGRILIEGHDFFSSPRLSPDGSRLAWLSWDHPNMPWDGTRLWSAEIAADGSLE